MTKKAARPPVAPFAALIAVAAVAATLTACGGSSDDTSGASADNSSPTAAAAVGCGAGTGTPANGTPIPLGAFVTETGGPPLTQVTETAQAYFDCLNANGGINGQPITYSVVDDGLNPQKTVQGANQLINDDKVVAMAASGSYLDCPVAGAFYEKAGLFEIEAVGGSPVCFTSPNITSTAIGATGSAVADAQSLVAGGAEQIVLIATSSAGIGPASAKAVKRYLDTTDSSLVGSVFYEPGVKDATSVMLNAANYDPDAIIVDGLEQDVITLFAAAKSQGQTDQYEWACGYPCYTPDFPEQVGSSWSGKITSAVPFKPFDSDSADAVLWNEVLDEYGSSVKRDVFSQSGFVAAKLVTDALEGIDGAITRESAAKAIQSISDAQNTLLCKPWYWAGEQPYHQPNHSFVTMEIDGDGWTEVSGCEEIADPALAPIAKAEER